MSITKVAEIAGVSSSTVSRVINNHPRVSPRTAEAVRKAMAELDYTPSDRRPGPKPANRNGKAFNIKFLALGAVRGSATPGFGDLLSGVSQAATHHGLRVSFSHVPEMRTLTRELQSEVVDGLLLHGQVPDSAVRSQLSRMPTVWVMGNRVRPDWGDQVLPDSYGIGELAATHLHQAGHEHLAFLNLDSRFWPFRRYEHAFEDTGRALGATVTSVTHERRQVESYWATHDPEAVEQLVTRLLDIHPRPTGLFVADDMQVVQIQPALQRRGIEIGPGHTELVSCNNELPYLAGLSPRPVSIDIRLSAIGRRAVEQLQWRLTHREVTERFSIAIEPRITPDDQALSPFRLERFGSTLTNGAPVVG